MEKIPESTHHGYKYKVNKTIRANYIVRYTIMDELENFLFKCPG